jgi:hypothetical protein
VQVSIEPGPGLCGEQDDATIDVQASVADIGQLQGAELV